MMLHLVCICNAHIVSQEENRPIVCWNCQRQWAANKMGTYVVTVQPKTMYTDVPDTRPIAPDQEAPK